METMRKLLLGLTLALMSCDPSALPSAMEVQARNALPQKDGVALGNPQALARSPGANTTIKSHLNVGNASDYYQLTYDVTQAVNGGVGWALDLVEDVVQWPPTKCGGDSCLWGPGSAALDPNQYQLLITHQTVPTDRYLYALSAEPKSNPGSGFLTILSGWAVPSPVPHKGAGEFTIDFDQAQKLDHPGDDVGSLTAGYNNFGPLAITVNFQGSKDNQHAGQWTDAIYQYADDATGGGDLQVAAKNTTSNDSFTIH